MRHRRTPFDPVSSWCHAVVLPIRDSPDRGASAPGDAPGYPPRVHRRALGLLFAVLASGLGLIAVFSALEGGGAWVIALAAAVLALWMADLARRALRRP
jgi:hypothetical protein